MGLRDQRIGIRLLGRQWQWGCPGSLEGVQTTGRSRRVAFVDLNDVHLTLIRCGELVRWKSELEILCLNELTGFGYAKDYDAVITIHSDGEDSTFALEYERQPKAANRYWQVRQAIEKERQVRCFLYLTPSYELLSYVAGFFDRCAKAVYFGVLEDFRLHGLDTTVLDSRRTLSFPLRAVLNGNGS